MEEEEKEKFFISISRWQNNYHYLFLYFLHQSKNRYYWDKYHFIAQNILKKSFNMSPKKIAICLFGVLRGAWKENLEEIIEVMAKPLNADCFLFSWDEYQEWPSLAGGHNWVARLLTPNFLSIVPKEIRTKESLAKYMPFTHKKLNNEYNVKINLDEFSSFIQLNPIIKRYELENQESFGENIGCSKLHYAQNRAFKVMEAYEYQIKSLYDIVILSRVDIKPYPVDYDKIINLRHDELTEYYTTWGSGRTCFVGYREAVKNYTSVYENLSKLKNNKFIFQWGDPHEIAYKYITLLGYRITEPITSDQIHHTTASAGFCFPDVSEEVMLDCKNLEINNILSKEIIYKIADLFKSIKEHYPQPSNKARCIDRCCTQAKEKVSKCIKIGENNSIVLSAEVKQKEVELQTSQDTINYLNNQLNTLNTEINSYPIKKQFLEISNLEQNLINKKLKAQILEKELGLDNEINLKYNNALQENKNLKAQLAKLSQELETNNPKSKSDNQKLQKINTNLYFALNYGTAKSRIKNQLTYKLGEAMIANSKSLWGYIKMPYILSYIKETHQKEQKLYQEKIKANPSLKLPPLETYPDYNEAIKIKNHLSYKLGEALINADKSKLKLGYITLWFKCKNITKEHKDNHKNSPNN
ncbi:coiled-coil domain-containing protein [Campylobacter devanensis]|uniref:coiled-coil domain-containing protein n=1 Tax=Campylobacter devanensis TaxID=3161138 RepID=UPI000A34FC51|nr:hypothetical protein [Campylobacter sp. P0111]